MSLAPSCREDRAQQLARRRLPVRSRHAEERTREPRAELDLAPDRDPSLRGPRRPARSPATPGLLTTRPTFSSSRSSSFPSSVRRPPPRRLAARGPRRGRPDGQTQDERPVRRSSVIAADPLQSTDARPRRPRPPRSRGAVLTSASPIMNQRRGSSDARLSRSAPGARSSTTTSASGALARGRRRRARRPTPTSSARPHRQPRKN